MHRSNQEIRMRQPVTTFTCSVYLERPAACRNYPSFDAQITFDSCLFVRQDIDADKLSQAQKERYCIGCGKCCYAWRADGKTNRPVARCDKLKVYAPGEFRQRDSETQALLNVIPILAFG